MPILPNGQIVNEAGVPTGQTVDLNTNVVSGTQNIPVSQSSQPVTNSAIPSSSGAPVPQTGISNAQNLAPGAKGVDVQKLQQFLMNSGFTIPAGATGYYGPQTQNALSQLQNKYGIDTAGYAGYFGPRTKSAIAQNQELTQKFQELFQQKKAIQPPQNNAEARAAVDDLVKERKPQEDSMKTAMENYYAMNPMAKQLYDTLAQISSSTNTKTSFVDTYNQLRQSQGIPELNVELLNMKKVIRGTEQDIRDEITKAGGTATESQVQAMVAARTRVLQNKAANIADQLQIANDYVDQTVKLTQADRQQIWNNLDRQIGLTEKMTTIQNDMNNAARTNYERIVTNVGYDGLAEMLKNHPAQQAQVERLLALPSGALSNPTFIQNAKTIKEQTLAAMQSQRDITNELARSRLAQGEQRINIQLQGPPGSNAPDILASQIQYYKSTGQLPPFGFGSVGQIARNNFWRALASEGQGITSDAQLNKVMRSSMSKALSTQQNQFSATKTSIGTLDKQLALVQQLSSQTDRTGTPIANKYLLYLKGQYAGDVNTAKLQNAVMTASAEFAKILSGSAASISGATVTSMEEAKNLINANMTQAQLLGVITQMRQEGQYRLSSQQRTIDQLQSDIQNIGRSQNQTSDNTFRAQAKAQGYTDAEIDIYLKNKR